MTLQSALLAWFAQNKRDLPWRSEPRNPYHVWLSEVMLQQTQVATVVPYFLRWLERMPTLPSLAAAQLDDVLKMWEGLGYYSRARNLHKAAQRVMRDYHGIIPNTVSELRRLPGIGAYTAGAIASLAYKQDTAVLDGNVKRVISRIYALESATEALLWQKCEQLLPQGKAGEFNEALMELGALVCTPRAPSCHHCPLTKHCDAYNNGSPENYPALKPTKTLPRKVFITLVCFNESKQLLMHKRPAKGLLGGLWEFPNQEFVMGAEEVFKADSHIAYETAIQFLHSLIPQFQPNSALIFETAINHAFTHFRMTRYVYKLFEEVSTVLKDHSYAWISVDEIVNLALTRSDQRIYEHVRKRGMG
jgi:A/G-specific adenine glycosylase